MDTHQLVEHQTHTQNKKDKDCSIDKEWTLLRWI